MIILLEPARPQGFVSGGYRYQDEVMRRVAAAGRGRQIAIPATELRRTVQKFSAETDNTIVVDGLFFAATDTPLPAGVIALLHTIPRHRTWSEERPHVIATGRTTAIAVREAARSVAIVRPGVDACFVPPTTSPINPRTRIVCVGTVCPAKGQLLLVESIGALGSTECDIVLIGDTSTNSEYVEAVRICSNRNALYLTGCLPPDEVARELQRADLFVSASRSESYGMAVAEAVACGVPVFAFATGEIAEHVGRASTLLPTTATDEEFAAQLVGALEMARLARSTASTTGTRPRDWGAAAAEFLAACNAVNQTR